MKNEIEDISIYEIIKSLLKTIKHTNITTIALCSRIVVVKI